MNIGIFFYGIAAFMALLLVIVVSLLLLAKTNPRLARPYARFILRLFPGQEPVIEEQEGKPPRVSFPRSPRRAKFDRVMTWTGLAMWSITALAGLFYFHDTFITVSSLILLTFAIIALRINEVPSTGTRPQR
ncbi:hypothetical protein KQI65_16850 [bacterium]|nr:hypothetical protein [bacterium]